MTTPVVVEVVRMGCSPHAPIRTNVVLVDVVR